MRQNRQIAAWALWDWGSAAFNAVMVTFVFSAYLASDAFGPDARGTTVLSVGNAISGIIVALTAPVVGHSVIYGMSDNRLVWWDNRSASHVGYRPLDSSEPFRAEVEARQPHIDPTQPAARFQGGGFVTQGPF